MVVIARRPSSARFRCSRSHAPCSSRHTPTLTTSRPAAPFLSAPVPCSRERSWKFEGEAWPVCAATGLPCRRFPAVVLARAEGGSMAKEPMQQELEDIELKLRSAREAAARAEATEKDKADFKLIEQEYLAAQQKERRQSNAGYAIRPRLDARKALDKK